MRAGATARATLAAASALVLSVALAGTASADAPPDFGDLNPNDIARSTLEDSVSDISPSGYVTDIDPSRYVEELEQEEVEGSTTTVTISADVLFEFDEATLNKGAEKQLTSVAQRLRNVTGTVGVVGHSDGIGDDAYNEKLSEDRAEAVKKALEDELGSGGPDIEASGRGSAEPVAEETGSDGEDDPAARAQNRRVEISFEGS
ncbi:outer membrane protein OmpA-like peptidoglycan-associated protein [Nocardiopsis mwathae]|uniref:Outer membrane protein OmpA-like peptidoglycan-associated protein n=1 Tax=Nocardiopsis mwathae TaxID=1472723 RepID=A0A7W9YHC9_9ACTN|nr:OmpA family protein [Nocardiopsis mwathae]MBB6172109.1 outer membrane protein OmpA-like peptidoglycan-associated protein [Nocardiopsis mwathae]